MLQDARRLNWFRGAAPIPAGPAGSKPGADTGAAADQMDPAAQYREFTRQNEYYSPVAEKMLSQSSRRGGINSADDMTELYRALE
jgi:hypothetical protein